LLGAVRVAQQGILLRELDAVVFPGTLVERVLGAGRR